MTQEFSKFRAYIWPIHRWELKKFLPLFIVVIDIGLTRVVDTTKKSGFALKGDVKFDEVAPKCSYITPVPGGVGLMTVAALMHNTLLSARKEIYQ
jgi:methylenetetrahydrofolate dehydrogenase (NADP+)/methenyltetrahydrofolate cyclohydrolase